MIGTHLIFDISNIKNIEKLKYSSTIIPILDNIVQQLQLKVVAKATHQFTPYGFTGVYVLSESHLSIHTFVDEGKIALDLYTCYFFDYSKELYEILRNEFGDDCEIRLEIIKRN
jgi:S-adenosylmethionine decarboxylase